MDIQVAAGLLQHLVGLMQQGIGKISCHYGCQMNKPALLRIGCQYLAAESAGYGGQDFTGVFVITLYQYGHVFKAGFFCLAKGLQGVEHPNIGAGSIAQHAQAFAARGVDYYSLVGQNKLPAYLFYGIVCDGQNK